MQTVPPHPSDARAHARLGAALEAQGDVAAAIAAYRQATALLPSLAEAHFRAACLLEVTGEAAAARASFRRAATAGAKTGLGRVAAARALLIDGEDAAAERVLRQALALDAGYAMAHEMLGTLLADTGRFAAARDCYERAIAAAPALAGSYYDLVRCRTLTEADRFLLARMQAALRDASLDTEQRLRLHLAIGKATEDFCDYGLAMRHFDQAHALRSGLRLFAAGAFATQAERIMARPAAVPQHDSALPVLIVGMPRSGTTLVEQILACHPLVAAGGELPFWNQRGAAWLAGGAPPAASDYLETLHAATATPAARVTDKMPLNFLWAGLVQAVLPQATIIHCRRTPIATALSIHQTYFNARLPFPTGGDALVAYCRTYQRLMRHWRRTLSADRFVEIDYEALTADPEPVIRRILAACGLPWDAACLRPEHHARVIRTPSKWQARQPIHGGAVARWRHYEPYLGRLRPLLEAADA